MYSAKNDPYGELVALRSELERLQLQNQELSLQHFHYQQYFVTQQQQQQQQASTLIQYPNTLTTWNPNYRNIFLGGALSADDWQNYVIDKLRSYPVCIYNPRREGGVMQQSNESGDPDNRSFWELDHLEKCNCVLFWFPWNHPNVTASLLQLGQQLGSWNVSGKAIFVGVHPKNKDKKLIYDFVRFNATSAYVGTNLDKLIEKVASWIHTGSMPTNSQSSSSDDTSRVDGKDAKETKRIRNANQQTRSGKK